MTNKIDVQRLTQILKEEWQSKKNIREETSKDDHNDSIRHMGCQT